ncbi:adenylate/guanylate cyclase domain-containing protein [Bradyrhizobium sp. 17]|uniref:adenylate/guanylate cyclase domain-containing protein n=1 Tax=Bradyrhizobium sp. 17 TaxID=2782649 RepID=UPI001FF8202D|nr:adenylate/guanylate cyclase domain-containing protein [Bradyrhizobium sp. 17]MCK1520970.1 adenylate/guanylate cyclase domain-containing protein [Bradyrhizobium sp. 17]
MSDFMLPVTRYAKSGDVSIAFQTMGDGPFNLIIVPGMVSHVEFMHEGPGYTASLRRLSNFARVVTFDKRGQGLSDRVSDAPSLEQRMDDVRAIMGDIGLQRTAVLGISEGSAMSIMFAATYPERVSQLILYSGFARSPAAKLDNYEEIVSERVKNWGSGKLIHLINPSQSNNPEEVSRFAKYERLSASPGAIKSFMLLNASIDVRPILSAVRVPTLVLHRRTDTLIPVEMGRDLAAQIPGAKYIEYPEGDHIMTASGDVESLLGDVEEFITGHRDSLSTDTERVLATVLFTDIVDSTHSAARMGDQKWRQLLDTHDQLAKQVVEKHRGTLIKNTGDGILAMFDGPGRAVRCALAFETASRQIGLPLRAGLHTGEIEIRGRDIGGIAVHAAARVMAQSNADEVLVSRVVTDLVAEAGLKFSDRGSHELKGLPGRWDLFAAGL